jgi:hypothetical protein
LTKTMCASLLLATKFLLTGVCEGNFCQGHGGTLQKKRVKTGSLLPRISGVSHFPFGIFLTCLMFYFSREL